jgi:hypothetical protein
VAGFQAMVAWQESQRLLLLIWVGFLPVAFTPSWQAEQVPSTSRWSTRTAGLNVVVLWQLSQLLVVLTCVGFLPNAFVPL